LVLLSAVYKADLLLHSGIIQILCTYNMAETLSHIEFSRKLFDFKTS
jgi:hypothetical protein